MYAFLFVVIQSLVFVDTCIDIIASVFKCGECTFDLYRSDDGGSTFLTQADLDGPDIKPNAWAEPHPPPPVAT